MLAFVLAQIMIVCLLFRSFYRAVDSLPTNKNECKK